MICWKISIFAPAKTTQIFKGLTADALWFAEKLVSLHQQKQLFYWRGGYGTVVICWKISIFAPAKTTYRDWVIRICRLWFAEKLVSLHQQKQQVYDKENGKFVVICWKISIFAPAKTTDTLSDIHFSCCDLLKN